MASQRVNVLGVGVSPTNLAEAVHIIGGWIDRREQHYVCVTPVHSIMLCHDDQELRKVFNSSGLTTPDGMPLVWLCNLRGYRQTRRVYGPDLLLALCERSLETGYTHYFYGGAQGVPDRLVGKLVKRFPGLRVVGAYSPPFRPLTSEEDTEIVRIINDARPDVVWIGLGAPKQERWMAEHISDLHAPVLIGVGAAFDFHAGVKPQAPYWMQRSGLEWLYRLGCEPRRLWKRYLYNNPRFVLLALLQALGTRRYTPS